MATQGSSKRLQVTSKKQASSAFMFVRIHFLCLISVFVNLTILGKKNRIVILDSNCLLRSTDELSASSTSNSNRLLYYTQYCISQQTTLRRSSCPRLCCRILPHNFLRLFFVFRYQVLIHRSLFRLILLRMVGFIIATDTEFFNRATLATVYSSSRCGIYFGRTTRDTSRHLGLRYKS
jgi:hypothetical protein